MPQFVGHHEYIKAMEDLLAYYQGDQDAERVKNHCPLCKLSAQLNHRCSCKTCPYLAITGKSCGEYFYDTGLFGNSVSFARESKDPAFVAARIPQLKEWIKLYREDLNNQHVGITFRRQH